MLDTIHTSLKDLENSFMLSSKEVTSETKNLKLILDEFSSNYANEKLNKSDILNVAKSIEKLSIKNEYKLNLLRDSPEYFSNIKYRKK